MAPSGSGGGTVEAWIYRTNNTAGSGIPERIICGCLNIGAQYTGWYLAVSSTGQLSVKGYITGNAAGPAINSGVGLVALNTWTHIAVSCVSGAVTFYINGVSYAGGTMPANWLINNVATATMVGDANPGWAAPFIGYISNLRMINNTALYTGSALTVPATPLTTTANTTLLTCQDSVFRDNSTNAYALTPTGDVRPAFANPFGFTTTSNIPFSPQVNIGSAYFDGTGDYLTVPHNASLDFNSDSWTVEFWVHPLGNVAEHYILGKRASTAVYSPISIGLRSNLLYMLGSTGSAWTVNGGFANGTTPVPSNAWSHIAVVKNGTTVTGYVNGKVDQTYTGIATLMTNTSPITVGATSADGSFPFTGYISNLRVVKGQALYTQAFAIPTQPPAANKNTVLQLDMDKAAIVDATANRGFETVGDAKLATESAYNEFNYSNYFDGTDGLQTPASSLNTLIGSNTLTSTATFTLECWIYQTQRQTWATYPCMMGEMQLTGTGTGWTFGPTNTGNLQFFWYDGANKTATGNTVIPLNTWTHIAVSFSNGAIKLFVNGNQETISGTTTLTTMGASQGYLAFGMVNSGGASTGYYGYISNFRVAKTAVYTASFTPSTTPITAITNTSLLTCQSNSFKDNSGNNFTLTRTGDTAVRSFNPFKRNTNTSMYFDGTGDYIYAPTASGTYNFGSATNFTIECWAYPIITTAGKGIFQISATAGGLQASVSTTLAIAITATNAVEIYANGTTYTTAAAKVPLGTWTHLAIVRSSGVTKLYINGVLETSIGTAGSITDTTTYPNTSLVVGGYYSTSYLWNGYIEDFRITKGTARYTANFTPAAFKLPNK